MQQIFIVRNDVRPGAESKAVFLYHRQKSTASASPA